MTFSTVCRCNMRGAQSISSLKVLPRERQGTVAIALATGRYASLARRSLTNKDQTSFAAPASIMNISLHTCSSHLTRRILLSKPSSATQRHLLPALCVKLAYRQVIHPLLTRLTPVLPLILVRFRDQMCEVRVHKFNDRLFADVLISCARTYEISGCRCCHKNPNLDWQPKHNPALMAGANICLHRLSRSRDY